MITPWDRFIAVLEGSGSVDVALSTIGIEWGTGSRRAVAEELGRLALFVEHNPPPHRPVGIGFPRPPVDFDAVLGNVDTGDRGILQPDDRPRFGPTRQHSALGCWLRIQRYGQCDRSCARCICHGAPELDATDRAMRSETRPALPTRPEIPLDDPDGGRRGD